MCQIALSIPDEVLYVSIGYCSRIAGMTEEEFIKYLGQNHISIFRFDDEEEFLEELDNA